MKKIVREHFDHSEHLEMQLFHYVTIFHRYGSSDKIITSPGSFFIAEITNNMGNWFSCEPTYTHLNLFHKSWTLLPCLLATASSWNFWNSKYFFIFGKVSWTIWHRKHLNWFFHSYKIRLNRKLASKLQIFN